MAFSPSSSGGGYLLENPVLRIEDYEKLCPKPTKNPAA
jgi:hypothetical protein